MTAFHQNRTIYSDMCRENLPAKYPFNFLLFICFLISDDRALILSILFFAIFS